MNRIPFADVVRTLAFAAIVAALAAGVNRFLF
jgi:hypothetical protein